jgi:hypothetical protein
VVLYLSLSRGRRRRFLIARLPQAKRWAQAFWDDPKHMTFEIKTFVLKNPTVILWLFITAAMTAMGLFLLTNLKADNIELTLLLATPLTIVFPLTLTYVLTSKVTFDDTSVTKKSFFIKTKLNAEKIKSYGVVGSSKSGFWLVDPDHISENDFGQSYFIFLSESEQFDLDSTRRQNNLRLQYRRDIYEKIKEWIKKPAPNNVLASGGATVRH